MLSETDLFTEKKIFSHIGLIMFGIVISSVIIGVIVDALFSAFFPESFGKWGYYVLTFLPTYVIIMPIAAFALNKIPASKIKQKKLNPGQLVIIFMICYFLVSAGNIASTILSSIISTIVQSDMSDLVADTIMGLDIWFNLIIVVILAPVIEELFYRKLLIERLSRYGERVAVITSGLIFGLVHGNISQFFYAFALGLAFGYVFVKTGKIRYTIAFHIIINFMGSVIAPMVLKETTVLTLLYGNVVLGIVIAGLVLFFINKKRISFKQSEIVLSKEKWKATVFSNVGMALFIVSCAVLFVLNTFYALA